MVEIAVALAAAQAAVAGIKQAIQVGKDAKECLGEFMQLFDAQDQIQKASTEERAKLPADKQKSAMSEALETVIAAKKVREMTEELKQFLVWSGQSDVWDEIQREHNAVVQRRKAAELAAKKKAEEEAAARLKRRKEAMLLLTVVGTGGIILYHIVNYIIDTWPSQ